MMLLELKTKNPSARALRSGFGGDPGQNRTVSEDEANLLKRVTR